MQQKMLQEKGRLAEQGIHIQQEHAQTGYVQKRYALIDVLRGICLLSMIAYHTAWDCVNLFRVEWEWFETPAEFVWQQSICWGFILLAGFCFCLSRHPFRHGLITFGAGALVTFVSLFVMAGRPVYFGVLTFLGSSMLLLEGFRKLWGKLSGDGRKGMLPESGKNKGRNRRSRFWISGGVVSFFLFLFFYSIPDGYVGFFTWKLIPMPRFFYANYLTAFLGFPMDGFCSSDYFPLIPWFFLLLTGYCGSGCLKWERVQKILEKGHGRILTWLGRHTLLLYLLHQPVIYGCLLLLF